MKKEVKWKDCIGPANAGRSEFWLGCPEELPNEGHDNWCDKCRIEWLERLTTDLATKVVDSQPESE